MDSSTEKSPYDGMSLNELLGLMTFDGPENEELWEAFCKEKQKEIEKSNK